MNKNEFLFAEVKFSSGKWTFYFLTKNRIVTSRVILSRKRDFFFAIKIVLWVFWLFFRNRLAKFGFFDHKSRATGFGIIFLFYLESKTKILIFWPKIHFWRLGSFIRFHFWWIIDLWSLGSNFYHFESKNMRFCSFLSHKNSVSESYFWILLIENSDFMLFWPIIDIWRIFVENVIFRFFDHKSLRFWFLNSLQRKRRL